MMTRTAKSTRLLAMLMAALVLFASLAACSNKEDNVTSSTTTVATSDNAPSTEGAATGATTENTPEAPALDEYGREIVSADLPDVRYDGETFTVHTRGNVEQYEWLAEEQTGDRLHDAIYTRNAAIEEKYGIDLVVIAEGTWSDYSSTTLPKIQASIRAGDGAYDLIAGYSSPFTNMVTTGMLYDLNTLKNINFDKPWWWQNFKQATEINGTNYFGLGALSLSAIYSMSCVLFNPEILSETNAGVDPYQLVLDGKWTWDKMTELSMNALSDLDGNAVFDTTDRYGMAFFNNANNTNQYIVGSGEVLTGRDADGNPIISVNQENMSDIIDKLIKMVHENESCYYGAEADIRKMFIDGKVLFHNYWLYYAQTQYAAQMDAYGILPTPKVSESQDNYHTWIQGGMHIYGIPVDVKNPERTSILTEAFAAETYASLLPQYYEVVLKNRYFKDEASSMMMDIMYDTVEFDFVRLFDGQIGILAATTGPITSKTNNFVSQIKATLKVGEKKLATVLAAVNKNITG